jgi:hypothetical protein
MKIALSNICLICNVTVERFVREVERPFIRPDGEIVSILAENGKPVEFGSPLFVVVPFK